MPHEHHHGCGHDAHDHDHDQIDDLGPQDSLFNQIDRENIVALNGDGDPSVLVKPWHERLDETKFLQSDDDDELIVHIPFNTSVKLRGLMLKAGPGAVTPKKVALYTGDSVMSFDDLSDKVPLQELEVVESREVGEYPLRTAKFSNVSSITLFFPESQGADKVQIYYIGFLGSWSEHKRGPVVTVYEAQANLADHEKIQGTDGAFSSAQF